MSNDLSDAGAGPNIVIDEAYETQILDIVSLEEKVFNSSWDEQMVSTSFYGSYDKILVATDTLQRDGVVGYIIFSTPNEDCELLRIAVSRSKRHQGIARKLMEAMVEICKDEDGENIFLEVRESNRAAINLYEKFGFEEISKRKGYYKNPPEDAVVMKLEDIAGIK